jgi:hypothetical protein
MQQTNQISLLRLFAGWRESFVPIRPLGDYLRIRFVHFEVELSAARR